MVLFVLKVKQYVPGISCQINSGPISKWVFWQYLSTTGSVDFEEIKLRKNILFCLFVRERPELPLIHEEGRVVRTEKIKWSVDISATLNKVYGNKRGNGGMNVESPVACFHGLLSMCLCVWQGETQNTQGGTAPEVPARQRMYLAMTEMAILQHLEVRPPFLGRSLYWSLSLL